MIRPATYKGRLGFTLVELLVVIAIIAILAGLITAGAMRVYSSSLDASNANDVNQLATAVTAFKTKFNVYPPSHLILYSTGAQYAADTSNLSKESLKILMRIWPRLGQDANGAWSTANIDWTGGAVPNFQGPIILQGDQCLVFFLGGIPSSTGPGVVGFSASPTNPALLPGQVPPGMTNAPSRIPAFFNFAPNRLVQQHMIPGTTTLSPFCSYADVYASIQNGSIPAPINGVSQGQPFAYFTYLGQPNQYNPYFTYPYPQGISDCKHIGAMPYCGPAVNNVTQYQNPTTFQIFSAGVDKQFGSNTSATPPVPTVWNPAAAGGSGSQMFTPAVNAAMDDRTNFCPNILGAGNAQ
jgi:prepilin-type N-terminal cleavage/methylation domain-containing protein